MAKSKKSKKIKEVKTEEELNRLPQNIVNIGERVEENKNIYILQSVYKEIHKFTSDKTANEAGGMLVGTILEEFGKKNIIINGFVEAKHCEATPTTLKFTHETWEYCHKEIDKKFPGKKIVGWIHTHPNYGIFLSEYDKFIQENFFGEEYEVAYVVDPIQNIEGFYFWINEKIERCKGFYIYDKTGKKIDAVQTEAKSKTTPQSEYSTNKASPAIAVLSVVVVILLVFVIFLNNKVNRISQNFEELVNAYNQNISYIVNQINSTGSDIENENKSEESSYTNDDGQINE